jgi:hypothetical protein
MIAVDIMIRHRVIIQESKKPYSILEQINTVVG